MFVRLGAEAGTRVLLGMSPENLVVKPLPGEAALFDPAKYSSHFKKGLMQEENQTRPLTSA